MSTILAENLTTARTHYKSTDGPCGLTQEELAQRAGLTAKAVSAIECGQIERPNKLTMARLAEALNTTVQALMGEDTNP